MAGTGGGASRSPFGERRRRSLSVCSPDVVDVVGVCENGNGLPVTEGVDRTIVCAACVDGFLWTATDQATAARCRLPAPTKCLQCIRKAGTPARPQRAAAGPLRAADRKRKPTKPLLTGRTRQVRQRVLTCFKCGGDFIWRGPRQRTSGMERQRPLKWCPPCWKIRGPGVRRARRPPRFVSGGLPSLGKDR